MKANVLTTRHPTGIFLSIPAIADTVPAAQTTAGNTLPDKNEELIKEVPKARKQDKPVAVIPVTVKPVIIKPKAIVKPIIKIH